MLTGMYTGAAAIDAYEKRQESFAGNLANISTPGYRRRVESFTSTELKGYSPQGTKSRVPRFHQKIDFTPGEIYPTNSQFDLALVGITPGDGNAFIAVQTGRGEEQYTRNGHLAVNNQGMLVHASSGFPLVNANGAAIRLNPDGGPPTIDAQGNIYQGGNSLGRLKIVRADRPGSLRPMNHGLYAAGPADRMDAADGVVEVHQGYLESSNVSPVNELIDIITNYRAYEASQRVIKQMDQSLQRLVRQTR